MKRLLVSAILATFVLGFLGVSADADAKRLGGGTSVGKQRTPPATAPQQASPTPTQQAQSTQAPPAAAAAAANPGFLSRYGGLLAGLGVGALLGSMLGGGGLGSAMSSIFMMLAVAGAVFLVFRWWAGRKTGVVAETAGSTSGMQFAGAGPGPMSPPLSNSFPMGGSFESAAPPRPVQPEVVAPDPETAALLRLAQSAFIRLQAANDAKDLDDIRSATTPEVYAELALQIRERGDLPQHTDVFGLAAELVEMTVEGDYGVFSVRYTGTIREAAGAEPQPFSEIWHLRKNMKDPQATWLIAGIQQA